MFFERLNQFDPEVYASCDRELKRQQHNIELIASENIVSEIDFHFAKISFFQAYCKIISNNSIIILLNEKKQQL